MANEIQNIQITSVGNIAERIEQLIAEARKRVVSAINTTMVYTYYEIGRTIVEEEQQGERRAEYGKALLKELAKRLTRKFGKGFSAQNLANMRQFYMVYSQQPILQTVSRKSPEFSLSWSHYVRLMRMESPDERRFYEIEAIQNNWSLREMQRQFDSSLYERLALSRDKEGIKALSQKGQIVEKPEDILKDPLFFNRLLRAFVLIDLKRGTLKHQDLGQMQMYVNYYDRYVKLEDENPTIGILLCRDKSDAVVEITLPKDNNQIFASKYQTALPSKEELKKLLEAK